MPSDLNQDLYVGAMADGLSFSILGVDPKIPNNDGWSASFSNADYGSRTRNEKGYWDYLTLPFTVDLKRLNGKIGTIKLRPKSGFYCTGQGGLVNFKYRIEGTTVVNGKSQYVDATGFITVSSSDWKGFARPDISNVSYNWPNNPQVVAALTVPSTIAGMPDDLLVVCGANKDDGKVGMNSTTHSDVLSTVTNYLTEGIFWVNEKLIGWAFGNFLPF